MSAFRLDKKSKAHFSSLAELGKAYGVKVGGKKRTSDKKKLEKQREEFAQHNLCRACKKPLTYKSGTNLMVCQNPECKGIKIPYKDEEGNTRFRFAPSYRILYGKTATVAENIFD